MALIIPYYPLNPSPLSTGGVLDLTGYQPAGLSRGSGTRPGFAAWIPRRPRPASFSDMANPLNGFDLNYPANDRDDSQDARDGVLQPSLSSHDPALMDFPNSYAFGAMLPDETDLPLQSFNRPDQQQGDLEGRLSSVMLTYDSIPSTVVSMPMSLDPASAFAYDVPTSYPATSLGLAAQLDQSQLHPSFSPFAQSMPPTGQYLQQQSAPQARKDSYNTASASTGSFEGSDFSRASDRSQVHASRANQRFQQYGQSASYRAPQPVAIQPKRPVTVKGELCT